MPIKITGAGVEYMLLPYQEPDANNDRILNQIKQFLSDQNRVAFMKEAANTKGGWEGWVQVETSVMLKRNNQNLDVNREEKIYPGSDDRVDLWLRNGNTLVTGIEIKCRNLNTKSYNDNTASFPVLTMKDITKVEGNIKVEYQMVNGQATTAPVPLVMYSIAVTGNPYDLISSGRAGLGLSVDYGWKKRQDVKWCYLHRHQGDQVDQDFARIRALPGGTPPALENLYLVWFKR